MAEAAKAFRKAVALGLGTAAGEADLGLALGQLGRLPEAAMLLQEAARRAPGDADTLSNLGIMLAELGRPEEGVAAFTKALGLRPDHANAHANLGLALTGLARFEEAIAAFERAIALEPGHPNAHLNLAVTLLLLGRFERGWEAYEHRWPALRQRGVGRRTFAQPQWRGEPLDGRTILLHAEQGLGDAIQFARYAPELAWRGAGRVLLLVPPALRRLLEGLPGVEVLPTFGKALPPFDLECPLLSLPHAFRTKLETTIPARVPYLRAEPEAVARWCERLGGLRDLRVGLAWAENPGHSNDRNRSIAFGRLAPLWRVPGVNWISLQVGPRRADLADAPAGLVRNLAPDLHDLAETAAAMSQLDLVLTVDTMIAHLAGALGRPAWVMLPFVPDWRWMLEREDSPWYPSLRLFRQERAGDWGGVVERVASELWSAAAPTAAQPSGTAPVCAGGSERT